MRRWKGTTSNMFFWIYLLIRFVSLGSWTTLDVEPFSPGTSVRRENGFYDDIQRAFYSGYFAGHGLKVQALSLPNGMIGSVYVSSLRNSDSGLLNLSGLNEYLEDLFRDAGMLLPSAGNQFPAAYADGTFLQLSCIVATRRTGDDDAHRIATRMSSE